MQPEHRLIYDDRQNMFLIEGFEFPEKGLN